MTSIPDVDVESDGARQRVERPAKEPSRSKGASLITLALLLLPLNAGILLYTAKNAADSRESLAALKRSIDGLKELVDKQGRHIARSAKAEDMAIVRQRLEGLRKQIADFDAGMRSGLVASGGSLIMSAPGKGVTQRLEPSANAFSAGLQVAEDNLASTGTQGVSVADLPHYERSISPEGKLILRKVR
ncbi:hypothetical protein QN219_11915 [Sinorhizobium sp. 7-81]|uniref:hypothetical protein n=1 Tax=Sinorhizobium sp. 8-89 TaxID=3049089 RepID=UPI0024C2FF3D|nr:hypothetical protein [Sinorhizobium sp. 8-89]MDK1490767.1 hypothetical protein [Sinorhizobium sp. 8-89]